MRYLYARLDQPGWMRHPMQDFLTASEVMHREELHAWNLSREDVQFALFYVKGDIEAYRERIEEVDPIRWYELTSVDDGSFYSYVCQEYTESDIAFLRPFADLSLVVVPPIVYDGHGRARMTIVGQRKSLTRLVDGLRNCADIGVEVLEVGRYDRRHGAVTGGLTDRQVEAIETATRLGYYAVPRDASLAAVADELSVAEATASELLRRAESNLMPRLVGIGVSSLSYQ
jgi:predicted DNA binding protein